MNFVDKLVDFGMNLNAFDQLPFCHNSSFISRHWNFSDLTQTIRKFIYQSNSKSHENHWQCIECYVDNTQNKRVTNLERRCGPESNFAVFSVERKPKHVRQLVSDEGNNKSHDAVCPSGEPEIL